MHAKAAGFSLHVGADSLDVTLDLMLNLLKLMLEAGILLFQPSRLNAWRQEHLQQLEHTTVRLVFLGKV
jgi:hypothetical protein